MADDWRLRPATTDDIDSLHHLTAKEPVYRYLFDAAAPDRAAIADTVARNAGRLWVLAGASVTHGGCVLLRPHPATGECELVYLLDPAHWGRGLATRMAWTAIMHAFGPLRLPSVFAGVDAANTASRAVLQRLGMRLRRQVRYPLGDGFEFEITPADPGPLPRPALIPLMTDDA